MGTVVSGIEDARGQLLRGADALRVQHPHRHDGDVPGHAGYAHTVVRLGADDPGDERAVSVVVGDFSAGRIAHETAAVDIVDASVAVVVQTISDFVPVGPYPLV